MEECLLFSEQFDRVLKKSYFAFWGTNNIFIQGKHECYLKRKYIQLGFYLIIFNKRIFNRIKLPRFHTTLFPFFSLSFAFYIPLFLFISIYLSQYISIISITFSPPHSFSLSLSLSCSFFYISISFSQSLSLSLYHFLFLYLSFSIYIHYLDHTF